MLPAGIYTFKVNNRNTRRSCDICSKSTIKTPERRHWCRSGFFIVNFEHISHLVLVLQLLTLSRLMPAGLILEGFPDEVWLSHKNIAVGGSKTPSKIIHERLMVNTEAFWSYQLWMILQIFMVSYLVRINTWLLVKRLRKISIMFFTFQFHLFFQYKRSGEQITPVPIFDHVRKTNAGLLASSNICISTSFFSYGPMLQEIWAFQ